MGPHSRTDVECAERNRGKLMKTVKREIKVLQVTKLYYPHVGGMGSQGHRRRSER